MKQAFSPRWSGHSHPICDHTNGLALDDMDKYVGLKIYQGRVGGPRYQPKSSFAVKNESTAQAAKNQNPKLTFLPQHHHSFIDGLDKYINFLTSIIGSEGCPDRACYTKAGHQWLGAVVACPDSHAHLINQSS